MARWVSVGIASLAAIAPAHGGFHAVMPHLDHITLLVLGLTGLTIGWYGARGRPND